MVNNTCYVTLCNVSLQKQIIMREYRLIRKRKGDLYYPQVRESKYLFKIGNAGVFLYYSEWKRIVAVSDGFVLNGCDDYFFGETWVDAKKIITDYEEQFMLEELPYVYSYDSQASVRYNIETRNNPKPKYQMSDIGKIK